TSAEALAGWAGFVDDATIKHAVVGGAVRQQIADRWSVGPEIVYMRGPDSDRDLYLTGIVAYDLASPAEPRPGRTVPYLVAGGGAFRHSSRFGDVQFAS